MKIRLMDVLQLLPPVNKQDMAAHTHPFRHGIHTHTFTHDIHTHSLSHTHIHTHTHTYTHTYIYRPTHKLAGLHTHKLKKDISHC